jgi:hypothetical protein
MIASKANKIMDEFMAKMNSLPEHFATAVHIRNVRFDDACVGVKNRAITASRLCAIAES